MKLVRNAVILGFSVGMASIAACSSTPSVSPGPTSQPGPGSDQTGTVGLELQLAPGITLSSVNYLIVNPTLSGFTPITGTIDVSGSQTIGVTLTLPVGGGYSLTLSATDTNSDACAAGPASFSVSAGASTSVGLTLVCSQTIDAVNAPDVGIGTVVFTADASLQTTVIRGTCAAATSLVAAPNETGVGHAIALTAAGIDPNNQSSDVTLTWSATGSSGSLAGSSGATNTFNCTSPGTAMVTATASITGGASCPSIGSLTVTLTCDGDAGAGTPDTGVADTGAPETSTVDAPSEAAAGPLAPCTTAGQTNCVQCAGNNKTTGPLANGLCTATEALFVQHDIAKGVATAAGNDPSGSCYDCLFQNTCLDDTRFADTGHDCADSATITTGTAAQCMAVLTCVLGSSTASTPTCAGGAAPAAVNCYCGTAPEGTTCQGNPASAVNGTCDAQIAAGLGFATQDGTDVTSHFTDGDKAAGVADQIINCAVNSGCTAACLN